MRTLYLRNVPDDVVDRLERLAQGERMSLNAFAVRELAATSTRANNVRLLADLPVVDIPLDAIVGAVDEGRR